MPKPLDKLVYCWRLTLQHKHQKEFSLFGQEELEKKIGC